MRVALLVLAAAAALTGCAGAGQPPAGGKLRVVATTPVVADFARQVGGPAVEVTQLLKPNVDPHDYEPSPADIAAVAGADVVVENGVGLDRWIDDAVSAAGFDGPVVDSSRGVAIRPGDGDEQSAGDPHIWHDPRNARIMVRNIGEAFGAADAVDRPAYERNAAAYSAQLDALDRTTRAAVDSIPAADRKLVTNHDALGYFCARYGLTFVGSVIPSFDSSAELSGKQLSALVSRIRETGVRAVFSEASIPPKTADTVAQEAGVQVVGGEDALYADGLGPPGSPGGSYLAAERHNTTTIVRALGGRV